MPRLTRVVLWKQIGPHFASGWLLPSGLTFPYLNSLRAWSPGRASNQFIRETMLDTLDSNAGITTVCFDCQRFVVDFVRDTGHRIFKDRLTKLELSGTASISDVDLIIGEFKALNDLVLKNVAYRRLSDEDRIPIFDTIMHAGDAENAPRFAHMTLSEQARDSRASRASLKIIQIQRLETDRYIDTEWIAGSTLSLLFEICGSGVEHVVIRGMRGTFLPLYGSYPHLRTLELDQSFEIDENHRSWQDVDPIMSCFAGHRPGGVDAIFHGFSAPELERVVIHGEGTLREKNIRPFLPNTDVDICITGKDRGAFAHYDVDWTKMM